mgnify:CR=1 FL=1
MVKTSKIPTVILDPDSLNQGNTIPEGTIIITAPKKKKPKPKPRRAGLAGGGMSQRGLGRAFKKGGKA